MSSTKDMGYDPAMEGGETGLGGGLAYQSQKGKNKLSFEDAQEVKRVREIFSQLMKAIRTMGIYTHNTARYTEFIANAFELMSSYIQEKQVLTIQVRTDGFLFKGEIVYGDTEQETNLAFKFQRDGIRSISFEQGLETEELLGFARVGLADFASLELVNEDMVTMLWREGLTHITYKAVEGLGLGGKSASEVEVDVDQVLDYLTRRLATQTDDTIRLARVEVDDVDAHLTGLEAMRTGSAEDMGVTDDLKARVQKELQIEEEGHIPKLLRIIIDVLEDELDKGFVELMQDILLQLFDALIIKKDFETISEYIKLLSDAVADGSREEGDDFIGLVEWLMTRLAEAERLEHVVQALNTGQRIEPLISYMMSLPRTAVPNILESLDMVESPAHRRAVCDVLVALGPDSTELFVEQLQADSVNVIRDMLYILERLDVPDRGVFIAKCLEHVNPNVRMEALSALAKVYSEEVRDAVVGALNDDAPRVRITAARVLARSGDPQVGDILSDVIMAADFANREEDERRAFFIAAGHSKDPRLIGYFKDILDQKSLFNRRKLDDLKLSAIQGLSAAKTPETQAILRAVATDKGQSKEVKDAALKVINIQSAKA